MKRFSHKLVMFVFVVGLITIMLFCGFSKDNEVEALSKYGSRGDEVKQIQQKLKNWGYYNGAVDGIYGSKTLEAVKYFQRKNGLTVDGIAGDKTLAALGIRGASNSSS
jgi:N-acetylmuramoyl-L-alanine amidase